MQKFVMYVTREREREKEKEREREREREREQLPQLEAFVTSHETYCPVVYGAGHVAKLEGR
jgi:hypothetical protein